jgi:hypothetical protein
MLKEAKGSASLACRRRAFGTMKKRSKQRFPFGNQAVVHAPMDRNFLLLFVIVPKARFQHGIVPEARLRHGKEALPSVP